MAESDQPSTQVRVMLWAPPQSLSTSFQKCLSFVDDIQIINEPYQCAAANNPDPVITCTPDSMQEVVQEGYKNPLGAFISGVESVQLEEDLEKVVWDNKLCTPSWVKNLLEGEFPGKKVVFAKDIICGIRDQYHMIPEGYRHTFLIRNPTKLTLSQRRISKKLFPLPEDEFSLLKIPLIFRDWYEPMLDFIQYLKDKNIEKNPIIIDADDLQDYPQSIVRQYCEALGIPYSDRLLRWPAGNGCVKNTWLVSKLALQGNEIIGFYKSALASTKFEPSKPVPPANEIPSDVFEVVKHEEGCYQKLYEMRIMPNKC
ncbi:uncharacterized protein [Amphiura filiformis]|uniref:uncharacterized protein n=1 Tax=Amphiura filiformis TaxID=82378 RepID=UPI003B223E98